MIDPILYTIKIGNFTWNVYWYGLLISIGVFAGTWLASTEVARRGENGEHVWDGLIWALPAGVIGARLWYVLADILGGSRYFLDDPLRILYIPAGGLHIYGALLCGGLIMYWFVRRQSMDIWLLLDSVAPSIFIAQAIGRIGNFINQELYGPPTDLPWGIPIQAAHRLSPWNDLNRFPEATTRFHPTFAYEMTWNLLCAGLLLWAGRHFEKRLKPGVIFAAWLVMAGLGRFLIEFFRPDQPRLPGTAISYTRVVTVLMALAGLVILLVKYAVLRLPFLSAGPETYQIALTQPGQTQAQETD